MGRISFSLCPFPDESADVNQSWFQSVQPFDSFPILLNVWPYAPWGIEGRLVFSLCPFPDESADVNQRWCQSDTFPRRLNCWPPKPPPPPKWPPCVSSGNFLAYIHSHMKLHMCAKFGANRPEFVLMLVRLFAAVRADSHKNTPKNNIYTSKIRINAFSLFNIILFLYWQNWADMLVIYHWLYLKWSFLVHDGAGIWAKCTAEHQRTASVFLPIPFVNMDPNNLSTIYIWILYAAEQHNKCGWYCINITFDLLNANAREMVLDEGPCSPLSGVVIWLGWFHLLFSSMGSTGTIVAGNGTGAFSIIMHVHSSFERDNRRRTVLST